MYVEYFNIIKNGAPGSSIFITIVFLLLVSVLLFIRFKNSKKSLAKAIPFFTIFGLVAFGALNRNSTANYRELKQVLINKEHSMTQGIVTDYIQLNVDSGTPESFTIDDINFAFTNTDSGAFNESGVLYQGIDVRIFHYNGYILSLWIKE
ncbi:MAG: hypothetical protein OCD02_20655 [Spirochaetaceae bacterium]